MLNASLVESSKDKQPTHNIAIFRLITFKYNNPSIKKKSGGLKRWKILILNFQLEKLFSEENFLRNYEIQMTEGLEMNY